MAYLSSFGKHSIASCTLPISDHGQKQFAQPVISLPSTHRTALRALERRGRQGGLQGNDCVERRQYQHNPMAIRISIDGSRMNEMVNVLVSLFRHAPQSLMAQKQQIHYAFGGNEALGATSKCFELGFQGKCPMFQNVKHFGVCAVSSHSSALASPPLSLIP